MPIGEGKRLAAFLHCDQSNRASQPRRRQPAYAKQLAEARRNGFTVPWLLLALSWDMAAALPRVVIPAGIPAAELDLTCVAGVECLVAHRAEPIRAIDVAAAALRAGATVCPVIDVSAGRLDATSSQVMAARWQGVAA